ncbi:multidrug transporter subunit MdtD [Achromobacter sp.]|uniref:multidrug transporter subunit MdtD n=1 Tax=Achromobacter sp. TaxID=134375 RepID=UPI00258B34F5|nr:multidrug transporter subunit MdtD [Achromobacter sp.]
MPTPPSQRALLWVVAACFFMQTLDTTIVNTALPAMARSLGEDVLALKPVVVAYTLTMAMLTPASGWLADRYGTRRVYLAAILVFAVGSVFCGLAQTLTQLTIARVVQGVGGSMLLPIGRLAVLRRVPGDQYISALAFVSIAGQVGPIFGPTLGGLLVQVASWHWIFMINVPIGLLGLIAVRRYLPEDALADVAPFDVLGCGLLSLCMVSFSLALDLPAGEGRMAWSSALFALSALTVLLYVAHARRRDNPLFQLRLFREPNFSVGLVGNLVCRVGSSAVPLLLPLLLQLQLGYTPLQSGLMMLPAAIAGTISKPWIAPLVRRFGYDTFLLANTVLVGAAIMSFAAISHDWPLPLQIAQLALFGAANSMQFAAMNSVTLKGLSTRDAGSGNSLFSMVQMLAIGLGVTIGGGLVGVFSGADNAMLGRAFMLTFLCVGAITLLSALVFRRLDAESLNGAGRRAVG